MFSWEAKQHLIKAGQIDLRQTNYCHKTRQQWLNRFERVWENTVASFVASLCENHLWIFKMSLLGSNLHNMLFHLIKVQKENVVWVAKIKHSKQTAIICKWEQERQWQMVGYFVPKKHKEKLCFHNFVAWWRIYRCTICRSHGQRNLWIFVAFTMLWCRA